MMVGAYTTEIVENQASNVTVNALPLLVEIWEGHPAYKALLQEFPKIRSWGSPANLE